MVGPPPPGTWAVDPLTTAPRRRKEKIGLKICAPGNRGKRGGMGGSSSPPPTGFSGVPGQPWLRQGVFLRVASRRVPGEYIQGRDMADCAQKEIPFLTFGQGLPRK